MIQPVVLMTRLGQLNQRLDHPAYKYCGPLYYYDFFVWKGGGGSLSLPAEYK